MLQSIYISGIHVRIRSVAFPENCESCIAAEQFVEKRGDYSKEKYYGSEKFVPGFTPEFFRQAVQSVDAASKDSYMQSEDAYRQSPFPIVPTNLWQTHISQSIVDKPA